MVHIRHQSKNNNVETKFHKKYHKMLRNVLYKNIKIVEKEKYNIRKSK